MRSNTFPALGYEPTTINLASSGLRWWPLYISRPSSNSQVVAITLGEHLIGFYGFLTFLFFFLFFTNHAWLAGRAGPLAPDRVLYTGVLFNRWSTGLVPSLWVPQLYTNSIKPIFSVGLDGYVSSHWLWVWLPEPPACHQFFLWLPGYDAGTRRRPGLRGPERGQADLESADLWRELHSRRQVTKTSLT